MKWVQLPATPLSDTPIYGRIDDDGLMRVTCIAEHPEFAQWLSAGNVPQPWEG